MAMALGTPRDSLLGAEFSGADIMLGFTLAVAQVLGVLEEGDAVLVRQLERLRARPAFQQAASA